MHHDSKEMSAALGRIPSGLFVLTIRKENGATGMLASWVQQCSFAPPRITIAVQQQRDIGALLTPQSRFTLNIIREGQNEIVSHFSRGFTDNEDPFKNLDVDSESAAAPVLKSSLAFLDCSVVERFNAGDHAVIIADVQNGRMLQESKPWVHIRKNGLRY